VNSTLDSHVLVYATDESSAFHDAALRLLRDLSDGPGTLYVFWPVVFGYVRLATDAGVFKRPITQQLAVENVEGLLARPSVHAVGFDDGFWHAFPDAAGDVYLRGDFVAHGYLVAQMRDHKVPTIWSRDRKFRAFQGIVVKDPFGPRSPAR
jgi:toxin-antitoxin system PIN domain toxin